MVPTQLVRVSRQRVEAALRALGDGPRPSLHALVGAALEDYARALAGGAPCREAPPSDGPTVVVRVARAALASAARQRADLSRRAVADAALEHCTRQRQSASPRAVTDGMEDSEVEDELRACRRWLRKFERLVSSADLPCGLIDAASDLLWEAEEYLDRLQNRVEV